MSGRHLRRRLGGLLNYKYKCWESQHIGGSESQGQMSSLGGRVAIKKEEWREEQSPWRSSM